MRLNLFLKVFLRLLIGSEQFLGFVKGGALSQK